MKDSVICKLTEPVKYGSENKETDFVEIKCPSYDNAGQRRYRRDLKAMLAAIIMDESKNLKEASEERKQQVKEQVGERGFEFSPGEVLMTVSASLGEDFSKAVDRFCEHAHVSCLLGGEEPLKSGPLNRMNPDDVDMLFATFIANFIMPSLMTSLSGSE